MKSSRKNLLAYALLTIVLAVVVVGSLTLLGHPVSEVFSSIDSGLGGSYTMSESDTLPAPQAVVEEASFEGNMAAQDSTVMQRMIIKNADLALEVEDVAATEQQIRNLANENKGYVVETATYGTDNNRTANLTIRVSAEAFEGTLAQLHDMANKVLSQSVSGEDVTAEYVDLESQKRNLEATRDRLLALLEDAKKVSDALEVNQALKKVQGELEGIQGRMKYLRQSAAMSTITVSLRTPSIEPIIEEEGWSPVAVARRSLRGLISFGQGLANVIIALLIWVPVWAPLIVLGWWLRRKYILKHKAKSVE